jgi:hypothetical protein
MSTPISPRLLKGALVAIDILNPPPQVILFQYNPDTLTRSIVPQITGPGHDRAETMRLNVPPQETIRLEVEFDATDRLAEGQTMAEHLGIHTELAALERLVYPGSIAVTINEALLRSGVMEVIAPIAPLTLFVWSLKRVVPVLISDFSIAEEAFDPALNPIRAKVTLGLRVLTYHDLGLVSPGGALFMAHQVVKEGLAIANMISTGSAMASNARGLVTSL